MSHSRALVAPSPPSLPAITELQVMEQIANSVAKTDIVPKAYRGKPGDILAAALLGREFGWSLMQSVNSINVIQGKPTMSAEAMVSLIRGMGHSITCEEWTADVCTLTGRHAGTGDTETVSFTMEDAKRAGLTGDNWRKYPKSMLRARCTTMLARALFADAIMGVSYTPEELGAVETVAEVIPPVASAPTVAELPTPAPARAPVRTPRRKVGPVADRCPECDGYGAHYDTGATCDDCQMTGEKAKCASHYEPAPSTDDPELAAVLDAIDGSDNAADITDPTVLVSEVIPAGLDNGNYIWHALQDIEVPHHSLTAGYIADDDANARDAELSFDVLGHLVHAIVADGRADGLADALDRVREATAGAPVLNGWALDMVDRMAAKQGATA